MLLSFVCSRVTPTAAATAVGGGMHIAPIRDQPSVSHRLVCVGVARKTSTVVGRRAVPRRGPTWAKYIHWLALNVRGAGRAARGATGKVGRPSFVWDVRSGNARPKRACVLSLRRFGLSLIKLFLCLRGAPEAVLSKRQWANVKHGTE